MGGSATPFNALDSPGSSNSLRPGALGRGGTPAGSAGGRATDPPTGWGSGVAAGVSSRKTRRRHRPGPARDTPPAGPGGTHDRWRAASGAMRTAPSPAARTPPAGARDHLDRRRCTHSGACGAVRAERFRSPLRPLPGVPEPPPPRVGGDRARRPTPTTRPRRSDPPRPRSAISRAAATDTSPDADGVGGYRRGLEPSGRIQQACTGRHRLAGLGGQPVRHRTVPLVLPGP